MSTRLLLALAIVGLAKGQFDVSACGRTKGCLMTPNGCDPATNCSKAFSWQVVGDYLSIELVGIQSGGTSNYIAVGFSDDRKMGNEPVTDCTYGPQGPSIHISYNPATYNQRINNYPAFSNDVQLQSANQNNNRLYCAFRQRIVPSQSFSQVQALNTYPIYVLLAVGTASDSSLNQHDMTLTNPGYPFVAPTALRLFDNTSYGVQQSSGGISPAVQLQLIKAHGIMMILAWFIFVATAIMFARYFRGHWPNTKPMGLLLWFHFHRTLNVIGVLLIIAAFVCIFTAQDWLWTGPTPNGGEGNSDWGSVHSMTGILACCLAWVQPVGAIFRCHPGKRFRPVFNWLHRFAGISGWLLAATSITIAAKEFLPLWSNTDAAIGLVIAYLVFIGIIIILQELLTICEMIKGRNVSRVDMLEMQAGGKGPASPMSPTTVVFTTNSKTKVARLLLLALFVVLGGGAAIALAVLIGVK